MSQYTILIEIGNKGYIVYIYYMQVINIVEELARKKHMDRQLG